MNVYMFEYTKQVSLTGLTSYLLRCTVQVSSYRNGLALMQVFMYYMSF